MKIVVVGIILSMVLITLTLCFSVDLLVFLQGKYGLTPGALNHGLITMGVVGIIAFIYWWATR